MIEVGSLWTLIHASEVQLFIAAPQSVRPQLDLVHEGCGGARRVASGIC